MKMEVKVSNKKLTEILIAEYFLQHYNLRNESFFRIDYQHVINRDENGYPDIKLINLKDNKKVLNIEVTRASSHFRKTDENLAAYKLLFNQLSKTVFNSEFKSAASVRLNLYNVNIKNVTHDIKLFKEVFGNLEKDSLIAEYRILNKEFKIIEDVTVKEDKISSVSILHWGKIDSIDNSKKIINAYESKKFHNSNNVILLIYLEDKIFDYEIKQIENFFNIEKTSFQSIAIIENVKYGRAIFIDKN